MVLSLQTPSGFEKKKEGKRKKERKETKRQKFPFFKGETNKQTHANSDHGELARGGLGDKGGVGPGGRVGLGPAREDEEPDKPGEHVGVVGLLLRGQVVHDERQAPLGRVLPGRRQHLGVHLAQRAVGEALAVGRVAQGLLLLLQVRDQEVVDLLGQHLEPGEPLPGGLLLADLLELAQVDQQLVVLAAQVLLQRGKLLAAEAGEGREDDLLLVVVVVVEEVGPDVAVEEEGGELGLLDGVGMLRKEKKKKEEGEVGWESTREREKKNRRKVARSP